MEHVITPPSTPLIEAPYAERVAFHIYVVSKPPCLPRPLTTDPTPNPYPNPKQVSRGADLFCGIMEDMQATRGARTPDEQTPSLAEF